MSVMDQAKSVPLEIDFASVTGYSPTSPTVQPIGASEARASEAISPSPRSHTMKQQMCLVYA